MRPNRVEPGPGQESVWDYPQPPRLEETFFELVVVCAGKELARTCDGIRVLEKGHPPTYYIPPKDVRHEYLHRNPREGWCEWKGPLCYYDLVIGNRRLQSVAWYHFNVKPMYAALINHVAFYPQFMDVCYVNGERVKPQPGRKFGGWVTRNVVGPFKGARGSEDW